MTIPVPPTPKNYIDKEKEQLTKAAMLQAGLISLKRIGNAGIQGSKCGEGLRRELLQLTRGKPNLYQRIINH